MATRRILALLESRATYGYSKNVMLAMRDFPELELATIVTGMHLIPELGNSVDLIREDGFPITAEVPLAPADETRGAWARAMGGAIQGFADAIETIAPDIILLSGDRAETFSCAVAGSYMGVPLAHVQAGDKSGHIDDLARMALAKLCHIHLASCDDSAERLRRLGEQEFRIHDVGAPQLDDIADRDFLTDAITIDGTSHDLSRPYVLVVQHPVMVERADAAEQMSNTVGAAIDTGLPVFCIYPNADLGYQAILEVIEAQKSAPNVTVLRNLERDAYMYLLANAAALVGNSSSGILEAPTFRVPVVNIGNRQRGRPQAANILNCGYAKDDIAAALTVALGNAEFRRKAETAVNPYGDGKSGARICNILAETPLDDALLDKQTVY